jgi:hypothetical protein
LLCLAGTASGKAALSPEKTASGDFFADPGESTWQTAPQPLQAQWETGPSPTQTASGRQVWLSADPLGESGGVNLYGYVLGDPINSWDTYGLCPNFADPNPGESLENYVQRVAPTPKGFLDKLKHFSTHDSAINNYLRYKGARDVHASIEKGKNVGADIAAIGAGGLLGKGKGSYPGNDPSKAPSGTSWKGKAGSCPGSKEGSYHNEKTGEVYRPDLDHAPPTGPHWDFKDSSGKWWRIFPDGRREQKPKR